LAPGSDDTRLVGVAVFSPAYRLTLSGGSTPPRVRWAVRCLSTTGRPRPIHLAGAIRNASPTSVARKSYAPVSILLAPTRVVGRSLDVLLVAAAAGVDARVDVWMECHMGYQQHRKAGAAAQALDAVGGFLPRRCWANANTHRPRTESHTAFTASCRQYRCTPHVYSGHLAFAQPALSESARRLHDHSRSVRATSAPLSHDVRAATHRRGSRTARVRTSLAAQEGTRPAYSAPKTFRGGQRTCDIGRTMFNGPSRHCA